MATPDSLDFSAHPDASCTVYDEGEFWSDVQPAHEIARMAAAIEQIAGWHANSGQSEIVRLCRAIRAALAKEGGAQ